MSSVPWYEALLILLSGFAAGWASFHWRIRRDREVSNDGA